MAYYIGLDLGTSSVGWAVTDENYHLMKKHGKDMWVFVNLMKQRLQKPGVHFVSVEDEDREKWQESVY